MKSLDYIKHTTRDVNHVFYMLKQRSYISTAVRYDEMKLLLQGNFERSTVCKKFNKRCLKCFKRKN
jgi:hypothetical protein